jgi:DNA-binding NarL/FixJ family response regulator
MAKSKSSVRASNINTLKFNPNLNISFINPDEVNKYKALGFRFMMSKMPDVDMLSTLTPQETAILKLLLLGNTPQKIAGLLSIDDSNVRKSLQHIREKMECDNNIQLVIKMMVDGLDSVLSQNR